MECQGECKRHEECTGEIKEVIVYGTFCPTGLKFNYCQTAREEDERRGFKVADICPDCNGSGAVEIGDKLQKKADDLKDERVRTALLNADIKGLSRDEAKAKFNNIVDEILGE